MPMGRSMTTSLIFGTCMSTGKGYTVWSNVSLRGGRSEKKRETVVSKRTLGKWERRRVVLTGILKKSEGFHSKVILPFWGSEKIPSIRGGRRMPSVTIETTEGTKVGRDF